MSSELGEIEVSTAETVENGLEAMKRVLASRSFARAPRLCSFLQYIVEKSAEGDVESLTEQQIGIYIFQRRPGYNSNDDNIVRGTARALRQRLATYYLTEGAGDSLRIEIPKGAYVAHFVELPIEQEAVPSEILQAVEPPPPPVLEEVAVVPATRRRLAWFGWAVALACAAVAVWPYAHERWVEAHDPGHLLWRTLFSLERPTYLVAGDAGLNMYETLGGRTVALPEYSQQFYADSLKPDATLVDKLGTRFYTPMSDLQLVSNLVRLPEAARNHVNVRFARDLAASDIKDANLVLMGTRSYNPWTELYKSQLSLQMNWDGAEDTFTVINRMPLPGEESSYEWSVRRGAKGALTLISLTHNPQGSGRVLLAEGTTMAAMFAATDFLSNKQLRDPILLRAKHSDGTLGDFDVLLQSDFIREGVSNLKVLAVHIR
ncbi:MAG: hypothetical protein PW792_05260 [Acidobacteriaceae bacterium]|nr:hypothetical protein [Acidobacteriaceae bacterium]